MGKPVQKKKSRLGRPTGQTNKKGHGAGRPKKHVRGQTTLSFGPEPSIADVTNGDDQSVASSSDSENIEVTTKTGNNIENEDNEADDTVSLGNLLYKDNRWAVEQDTDQVLENFEEMDEWEDEPDENLDSVEDSTESHPTASIIDNR
ncbi:hypothetical protein BJV82DRAFT_583205 [Fennellomyces sp. T-0311]|nr:hypothetical protein BJV82DRAFT_583205 [Fennellomyces sp. T-0311]